MTREEIHAFVDELTEDELLPAEMYLRTILEWRRSPPRDNKLLAHFDKRFTEYHNEVDRRWHTTVKKGYVSGMGGGRSVQCDREGRVNGESAFTYQDGDARVIEKLRVFANRELQSVERYSLAPDGSLRYEQQLEGGGRTVRIDETFPAE